MNLPTIMRAKNYTDFGRLAIFASVIFAVVASTLPANAEWKIDLSRRQKAVRSQDAIEPSTPHAADVTEKAGIFDALFDSGEPVQEIVILNTEKGFLPANVRMRKGGNYLVHVVNVNEKEKNVSFVLDAFSEHHGTFFGQVQSFRVTPKKEGVYSYQCPETSVEGRVVVFAPQGAPASAPEIRAPASEPAH